MVKPKGVSGSFNNIAQYAVDEDNQRIADQIKSAYFNPPYMFRKTGNVSIIQLAIPLIELVISRIANPTISSPINFSTAPRYLRNLPANLRKGLMKKAATMNGSVKPKPKTNNNPMP